MTVATATIDMIVMINEEETVPNVSSLTEAQQAIAEEASPPLPLPLLSSDEAPSSTST
eukprot:CAMPEP_0170498038 /NCGR_PEP_ID=MMETSP0208-20121228/26608_1 /TAXON_ID=197538 /ORGANISM="Strombidium inclinatum, Strain S3" /LENGTH=57 /DNA_ID=CAMNT_0010775081 /DNA_START=27 /DNA_END=196 /DNA_ORIENTATION=+